MLQSLPCPGVCLGSLWQGQHRALGHVAAGVGRASRALRDEQWWVVRGSAAHGVNAGGWRWISQALPVASPPAALPCGVSTGIGFCVTVAEEAWGPHLWACLLRPTLRRPSLCLPLPCTSPSGSHGSAQWSCLREGLCCGPHGRTEEIVLWEGLVASHCPPGFLTQLWGPQRCPLCLLLELGVLSSVVRRW
jgi:hypothetical protein